jgi:1,4-dihydroxy-2-naphthoyl-CoA hydrolase
MSNSNAAPAFLNDTLGIEIQVLEAGHTEGQFEVASMHMAPNGYLHAASVIALADTCCGVGCMNALPQGADSFTTVELKSNFLGTAAPGDQLFAEARLVHGGRTTQVWDATVTNKTREKPVALFRCTQLILYPKA